LIVAPCWILAIASKFLIALDASDFFLRLAVYMCEDLSSIKTIKYLNWW